MPLVFTSPLTAFSKAAKRDLSILSHWYSVGLLVVLTLSGSARAGEYVYNLTYGGTAYTTSVYCDDSIPAGGIKGVIVAFNYGNADQAYTKTVWRNFAKDRNLALCLMMSQDTFGVPAYVPDGMTILNNTLTAAATGLGHTELAASTLPLIFVGISRGGTSGAINFGWNYGKNRTVACLAFHGNSFDYLDTNFLTTGTNTSAKAAHSIPVFYPTDQLDSGPYRQTDIETAVRTTNTTTLNGSISATSYGYRPRYGLFWTTTMQYGVSHSSLGDDTYPLQWLGRVWSLRYNAATPGTLNAVPVTTSSCGSYTLTNGASNTAYYASPVGSSFTQKNGNIWIPPGGMSEWIAETSQPIAGTAYTIDTTSGCTYTAPDNLTNRTFTGAGTLTFSGAGTVQLDNGASGSPNNFNMTGGTINVINGATLSNGTLGGGVWTNNKASLYVDATSTFKLSSGTGVQIDALSGSGTVTVGLTTGTQTLAVGANNSSSTFSGVITSGTSGAGSLSLIKTGSGTVTLTGSNSFSSGTSVMGGTLLVSNGGTLGTGNLSIANGAICSLTNTAGGLSSTASVTIGTTGTLNLGTGVNLKVASLAVNGQTLANGAWNSVRDPVHFTGSGTVLVASAGATAQQDWRQSTFGTTVNTGSAADNADPDGDGVKNLMEFALGTGPLSANTTPISLSVSGGILNFTYRRSHTAEADGMVYIVEWSDTLGNDWSTTGVTQSAVSGTDDGLTQNYVATVPAGSNGRRAVRLRVTHP